MAAAFLLFADVAFFLALLIALFCFATSRCAFPKEDFALLVADTNFRLVGFLATDATCFARAVAIIFLLERKI